MLASILSGELLLHIPCWLMFYLGTFSYTSRVGFICMRDVSLTHPELVRFLMMDSFFLSGEFLLHIPYLVDFSLGSFSYTSHAGFNFTWGISLTHPVLALILSGEFLLLHISCWLQFYLGSFSYTPRAVS